MYEGKPNLTPDIPHFAVATAVWLNLKERKEIQVWVVPPGVQKTKTLLSVVHLLIILAGSRDILVRCPTS